MNRFESPIAMLRDRIYYKLFAESGPGPEHVFMTRNWKNSVSISENPMSYFFKKSKYFIFKFSRITLAFLDQDPHHSSTRI
jgi:hypothetical protein